MQENIRVVQFRTDLCFSSKTQGEFILEFCKCEYVIDLSNLYFCANKFLYAKVKTKFSYWNVSFNAFPHMFLPYIFSEYFATLRSLKFQMPGLFWARSSLTSRQMQSVDSVKTRTWHGKNTVPQKQNYNFT